MTKITENHIELLAIEELELLGYSYMYGPVISSDGEKPERANYEEVLLPHRVKAAIARINPSLSIEIQTEGYKELQRIHSPELLTNNETFHRMLTEGIPVDKQVDGYTRGDRIWLVDFENPENNEFLVVNQFTI